MLCTLVEYPFEMLLITDKTVDLAAIFGVGHWLEVSTKLVYSRLTFLNVLEPMITLLEKYQKRIFEQFDTPSLQLQLCYERPIHLAVTPDLA